MNFISFHLSVSLIWKLKTFEATTPTPTWTQALSQSQFQHQPQLLRDIPYIEREICGRNQRFSYFPWAKSARNVNYLISVCVGVCAATPPPAPFARRRLCVAHLINIMAACGHVTRDCSTFSNVFAVAFPVELPLQIGSNSAQGNGKEGRLMNC